MRLSIWARDRFLLNLSSRYVPDFSPVECRTFKRLGRFGDKEVRDIESGLVIFAYVVAFADAGRKKRFSFSSSPLHWFSGAGHKKVFSAKRSMLRRQTERRSLSASPHVQAGQC